MCKLAIIGASYLQLPLIIKAKEMGLETHVFAWVAGDVGETAADHFYPISIIEKEQILDKCREIGISGICSIGSDLAIITVNYVAWHMGLVGNSPETTRRSTNKHAMRLCFEAHGDPSPQSIEVDADTDLSSLQLAYPVIIKPLDRSGSRGITKLERPAPEDLAGAVRHAMEQGFEKKALIEEFAEGKEYSVEYLSWKGIHHFLNVTEKFTTGAPNFIETGHLEPAPLEPSILQLIKITVSHALTSLGIEYGASHSEVKIAGDGIIKIIEIGGRMGGDFIGSHLVQLTTGVDFVRAVIDTALGKEPCWQACETGKYAAVKYFFTVESMERYRQFKNIHPELIITEHFSGCQEEAVTDSSNRPGCAVLQSGEYRLIEAFLAL